MAVLAVLGFLLVTTANSAKADRREAEPRKEELIRIIESRRSHVGDLDAAVAELRGQVTAAERRAARVSRADAAKADGLRRLAMQAGTTALRGGGVQVRLADSAKPSRSPDDESAGRIHDVDVQLVVNALFGAGAEAVAVNGNRVVATTAMRSAGDTLVVNFRPLRPPYRVDAIGADLDRFNNSDIAQRFRRWTRLFGLSYSTARRRSITIPAFTGRVAIAAAAALPPSEDR
ncbi:MAG: DUF881 domain-containing protein [Actinobacteria bacterium]|nr:DUF881 domain-containing protein [Actinomycetota bacterium]